MPSSQASLQASQTSWCLLLCAGFPVLDLGCVDSEKPVWQYPDHCCLDSSFCPGIDDFGSVSEDDLAAALPFLRTQGVPYYLHAELPDSQMFEVPSLANGNPAQNSLFLSAPQDADALKQEGDRGVNTLLCRQPGKRLG